jgi:hypothetical protein
MDWAPTNCTDGAELRPPHIKVGWTPCSCPRATGSPRGHQYVAHTVCWREYREGGCDALVDGRDPRPDVSGVVLGGTQA